MDMPQAVPFIQVGAAVLGVAAQQEGQKQVEKASQERQKLARVQRSRERRKVARETIIQQAAIKNVAAQTGTAGSSGAIGAEQTLTSRAESNLGLLDAAARTETAVGAANVAAARAQTRASIFSTVGSLAEPVASLFE
jgi:hypothetical protein